MTRTDGHPTTDAAARSALLARCDDLLRLTEEAAHTYIIAVVRGAPPEVVAMARRAWQDAATALIAGVQGLVPPEQGPPLSRAATGP